jgi:hypothetical protein
LDGGGFDGGGMYVGEGAELVGGAGLVVGAAGTEGEDFADFFGGVGGCATTSARSGVAASDCFDSVTVAVDTALLAVSAPGIAAA